MPGYVYVSIWYKHKPDGNINISNSTGISSGITEEEAIGYAMIEGRKAFPEHMLSHYSVTKIQDHVIDGLHQELHTSNDNSQPACAG